MAQRARATSVFGDGTDPSLPSKVCAGRQSNRSGHNSEGLRLPAENQSPVCATRPFQRALPPRWNRCRQAGPAEVTQSAAYPRRWRREVDRGPSPDWRTRDQSRWTTAPSLHAQAHAAPTVKTREGSPNTERRTHRLRPRPRPAGCPMMSSTYGLRCAHRGRLPSRVASPGAQPPSSGEARRSAHRRRGPARCVREFSRRGSQVRCRPDAQAWQLLPAGSAIMLRRSASTVNTSTSDSVTPQSCE
jgi:hypothetical protein